MHSIRLFRNKPQHAKVIKCWINDETEQTFAVCEVCCTKEHLAPIKMTRSFEGISLLSASVKFSAGIFKYKLAPLYSCYRPSILYHRSYTTGLPNPNHNLSWGEGRGMNIIANQSITGPNSQAQTMMATNKIHTNRQECMWCTTALKMLTCD